MPFSANTRNLLFPFISSFHWLPQETQRDSKREWNYTCRRNASPNMMYSSSLWLYLPWLSLHSLPLPLLTKIWPIVSLQRLPFVQGFQGLFLLQTVPHLFYSVFWMLNGKNLHLCSAHFVPGSVISTFFIITNWILTMILSSRYYSILILMRKLR